jgi:histidinol-phosphate phosphatase family protein
MITQLLILAGGKGTRLSAVAPNVPKALVPVGGKPVLQHQLELAAKAGVREVRIFAGHLADQIHAFVGDGSRFGLKIVVEVESVPLGSAGAVLQQLDRLAEQFYVAYGDTMLAVDLVRMAEAHEAAGADLTTFVHPNDHPMDSDLVEADGRGWVTALHPYPHPEGKHFGNLVNAALYVIRREALRPWAGQAVKRDFAKDVLPALLAVQGKILSYRSIEYIKDMGTPTRLEKVEKDWAAGRIRLMDDAHREAAVFLDRDGTLNRENGHIRAPEQFELLPGVATALKRLRGAGFRLVVLTNQPVIARGEATEADVEAIHRKLEWELGLQGAFVDAIYYCPHHPDRGFPGERVDLKGPCACRKPGTELMERACRELGLDPRRSWMVGDTTIDMEFARRAGVSSILVQTGEAGRDGKYPEASPLHTAADLAAAADRILAS